MNSSNRARRKAFQVVVGYNLPLALWTCWALFCAWLGSPVSWPCIVKSSLGWCPGCGLTREYGRLLSGNGTDSYWLVAILAGFVFNGAWSVLKARRMLLSEHRESDV